MPFRLKGAAATFPKLISVVFKDLREAGKVHTYLDDKIIPSRTWDEMCRTTVVLGVQRGTEIIRDNLGFMYYKNKVTDTKM